MEYLRENSAAIKMEEQMEDATGNCSGENNLDMKETSHEIEDHAQQDVTWPINMFSITCDSTYDLALVCCIPCYVEKEIGKMAQAKYPGRLLAVTTGMAICLTMLTLKLLLNYFLFKRETDAIPEDTTHPQIISRSQLAIHSSNGSPFHDLNHTVWSHEELRGLLNICFGFALLISAMMAVRCALSYFIRRKMRHQFHITNSDSLSSRLSDAFLVLFCNKCVLCQEYSMVQKAYSYHTDDQEIEEV